MKKVIAVKPLENYILQLEFDSNEVCFFDVKPYLNKGIFSDLKNEDYFKNVRTNFGSIAGKTDKTLARKRFI